MQFYVLSALIAAPLILATPLDIRVSKQTCKSDSDLYKALSHAGKHAGPNQVAQCFVGPKCHFGMKGNTNFEVWGKTWDPDQKKNLQGAIGKSCGGVADWDFKVGGDTVQIHGTQRQGSRTWYDFSITGTAGGSDLAGCVKGAIVETLKLKDDIEGKVGDCLVIDV